MQKYKGLWNYCEQLHGNKRDKLEETDRFLEKFNLPRVNQEEIEIMNNSITNTKTEAVIKNLPAILIPACEPSSPAFLIMYSLPLNNNSNKKLLVLCLPCFFSRLLFFLFPLKSSTLKPRYVSTNQMYWTLKQMKDQRRTLVLKCVMDKIRHLIESN